MPIEARRFLRKMRGGAQAHLIEAADGNCYVVKFLNNPQHRRILVNEWLAAEFLRFLGLSRPDPAVIRISREFLTENPEVSIQLGSGHRSVEPGWHFGSRFPGDPARTIVYDFLPDSLLEEVENRAEFVGMLAFDQWMSNADSRQAIFFRARLREWLPRSEIHPPRQGFVAYMVDNGFVFDGPNWRIRDFPLQGLYFRPAVYRDVRGLEQFQPWLDRIVHFPENAIDSALKQLPPAWIEKDESELMKLLEELMRRRKRTPDLIQDCRRARPSLFPEWK